jgi:SAM-dependent methyltransferase
MVPLRWHFSNWDKKAKDNPFFAIMSARSMRAIGTRQPNEQELAKFFEKGRRLKQMIVDPALVHVSADGSIVEYGCGAGRILRALSEQQIGPLHGLDIAPTMLELCRHYVPQAMTSAVDADGAIPLADGCARLVYSYAVLQHINRLSVYERAIDEMCRIVAPGGVLAIQLPCKDIANERCEPRGRTWNFERASIYPSRGLYIPRPHTTWYGVVTGFERLARRIARHGLAIRSLSHPKGRLWSALVIAKKDGSLGFEEKPRNEMPTTL